VAVRGERQRSAFEAPASAGVRWDLSGNRDFGKVELRGRRCSGNCEVGIELWLTGDGDVCGAGYRRSGNAQVHRIRELGVSCRLWLQQYTSPMAAESRFGRRRIGPAARDEDEQRKASDPASMVVPHRSHCVGCALSICANGGVVKQNNARRVPRYAPRPRRPIASRSFAGTPRGWSHHPALSRRRLANREDV